jgi:hypothetical protein
MFRQVKKKGTESLAVESRESPKAGILRFEAAAVSD